MIYMITLTDDAHKNNDAFIPNIMKSLAEQGCQKFEFFKISGTIAADLPKMPVFTEADGVSAVEEERVCTTQELCDADERQTVCFPKAA